MHSYQSWTSSFPLGNFFFCFCFLQFFIGPPWMIGLKSYSFLCFRCQCSNAYLFTSVHIPVPMSLVSLPLLIYHPPIQPLWQAIFFFHIYLSILFPNLSLHPIPTLETSFLLKTCSPTLYFYCLWVFDSPLQSSFILHRWERWAISFSGREMCLIVYMTLQ